MKPFVLILILQAGSVATLAGVMPYFHFDHYTMNSPASRIEPAPGTITITSGSGGPTGNGGNVSILGNVVNSKDDKSVPVDSSKSPDVRFSTGIDKLTYLGGGVIFSAGNREVFVIDSKGVVRWNGHVVKSDAAFRKAMLDVHRILMTSCAVVPPK